MEQRHVMRDRDQRRDRVERLRDAAAGLSHRALAALRPDPMRIRWRLAVDPAHSSAKGVSAADPFALPRPLHCDWIWRAGLWAASEAAARSMQTGVAAGSGDSLSAGLKLYHDAGEGQALPALRMQSNGPAPQSLVLRLADFVGSYVSLAVELPETVLAGLDQTHLLGVHLAAELPEGVAILARLNIRHGPNLLQMSEPILPAGPLQGGTLTEFDLAYEEGLEPPRLHQIWYDLILSDLPARTEPDHPIVLHDLVFSRRPRAVF